MPKAASTARFTEEQMDIPESYFEAFTNPRYDKETSNGLLDKFEVCHVLL
jgi:hypothetical protein